MEEVKKFVEKLRNERDRHNQKLIFVIDHKFTHEEAFLRERVKTINKIMYELESVVEGKYKTDKVSFDFE